MTTRLTSPPTEHSPGKPSGWRRLVAVPAGRRSKFFVLLGWLVLASIAGPLAVGLSGLQDNDALTSAPYSSESHKARERIADAFPGSDALVAVAVYVRDSGLTPADRAAVETDRSAFARYALGGTIPESQRSADGKALLLVFPLAGDDDAQSDATTKIRDAMEANASPGLATGLTGSAGALGDVFDGFEGMDITLVLVTAGVVTLLLLITYRSPVLWLVPLVTVGIASQVASAIVYLLAKNAGLSVDLQGQSVLAVLVFGVGTDYALLLISRYREELHRHEDRHVAMAAALRRSLPAVLASAVTVALALLCLLFAQTNASRTLGPVAAIGVLAAFVTMTTLLPALLVICGRWVFWPFVPRFDPNAAAVPQHRAWGRVAGLVGRAPGRTWVGSALVLVVLACGATTLGLGIPNDDTFTSEVGSVRGQHLIEKHYPGGASDPAEIVARSDRAGAVVTAVQPIDGVAVVARPETSADGGWTRIDVTLDDAPDSQAAKDTVDRLRDAVSTIPDTLVTGTTADVLDSERATDRDHRVVMPMILLVVLLVLIVLLRALVAPLVLVASVVLSYAAALGGAAAVLHLIGHPDLEYSLPLQSFLFLVALGVDYTIFLMTRAREEVGRVGHRQGVLRALTVTGGVVTSAGVVLAATFSALTILPLTPSVQLGVIVAVGVLLDTFVVRSLLVPALAVHLGPRIWWPTRPAAHE